MNTTKTFWLLPLLTLCAFAPNPTVALAEDHPLTEIRGQEIELKVADHAIAGSIRDFVVFGYMDEGHGKSHLTMKKDGQIIQADFGTEGTIRSTVEGVTRETKMKFVGVDRDTATITVDVNGTQVPVRISSEGFVNNHFINPIYSASFEDQGTVYFYLRDGKACYGYSLHLIFMVLGAYLHP